MSIVKYLEIYTESAERTWKDGEFCELDSFVANSKRKTMENQ
jgi:hypothetical protein